MLLFLLLATFRFFFFAHPPILGTIHGRRDLKDCVRADRPGTAFGIPCFHAEFPVVSGAESSEEHNLPGNLWNPRGECSKEHGLTFRD